MSQPIEQTLEIPARHWTTWLSMVIGVLASSGFALLAFALHSTLCGVVATALAFGTAIQAWQWHKDKRWFVTITEDHIRWGHTIGKQNQRQTCDLGQVAIADIQAIEADTECRELLVRLKDGKLIKLPADCVGFSPRCAKAIHDMHPNLPVEVDDRQL